MVRKKDSIALFEVIAKGQSEASTPSAPPQKQKASPDRVPEVRPAGRFVGEGRRGGADAPKPPRPSISTPRPKREPALSADGERIRVSLSAIGWTTTGVVALLTVLGAFFLGRSTAQRGTDAPVRHGALQPVDAPQAGGGSTDEHPPRRPAATPPVRAGAPAAVGQQKYYVVIQNMNVQRDPRRRLTDARRIVGYLGQHGVSACIYRSSRGEIKVLSQHVFDEGGGPDLKQHVREIEALGKNYDGGYRFEHDNRVHTILLPWPLPEDMKIQ